MLNNRFQRILKMTATSYSNLNLMEKFDKGDYSLRHAPRILLVNCKGVFLHKEGLQQDVVKSLEDMNWSKKKVLSKKLTGKSFGDFTLLAGFLDVNHFPDRTKLDELYSKHYNEKDSIQRESYHKISLQDALSKFTVTLSPNMEFYKQNPQEMEKDLGRSLSSGSDPSSDESELLYKLAEEIFGEDEGEDEEKALMFNDFHLLYSDGNDTIATARRGQKYLLFNYMTS